MISPSQIDTNRPFTAKFAFDSTSGGGFGYSVTLEQDDGQRRASIGTPVKYIGPPGKGAVASADAANALLSGHLQAGMTLVASYWAGKAAKDMAW